MTYSLANRIAAEKAITKALVVSILTAGYSVKVFNGEEMSFAQTAKQAVEMATAVDECSVYACKVVEGESEPKSFAVFHLVYGNDGYDLISDHSVNDLTLKLLDTVDPVLVEWETKLTA